MGTFILLSLIRNEFDFSIPKDLNILGKICIVIANIVTVILAIIIMIPLSILENIIIVPAWLFYNLAHKKESRKSYSQFINKITG
mgnify:CR=1 FL=1